MTRPDDEERQTPEGLVRENLIRLRNERDWSQSEVARRMVEQGFPKYNQMMVSRTEKGERPLRLDEVAAYASVFSVGITQLWRPARFAQVEDTIRELEAIDSTLRSETARFMDIQFKLAQVGTVFRELVDESAKHPETSALRIQIPPLLAMTPAKLVQDATEQHLAKREAKAEADNQATETFLDAGDFADEYLTESGDPYDLLGLWRSAYGVQEEDFDEES